MSRSYFRVCFGDHRRVLSPTPHRSVDSCSGVFYLLGTHRAFDLLSLSRSGLLSIDPLPAVCLSDGKHGIGRSLDQCHCALGVAFPVAAIVAWKMARSENFAG